jgi:hypothetical protein
VAKRQGRRQETVTPHRHSPPGLLHQLRKLVSKQDKPYQTLIHELLKAGVTRPASNWDAFQLDVSFLLSYEGSSHEDSIHHRHRGAFRSGRP